MQTQIFTPQSLVDTLPEKPMFPPDQLMEFCAKFQDPVAYPQLVNIGMRWDRAIQIACTREAVTCADPVHQIFLVRSQSNQDLFYRVDLSVKLPAVACTCADDRRHPDIPCKHRIAAVLYRHFIEIHNGLKVDDLCRAVDGRLNCFAVVLDVYANWIRLEVTERRGRENYRVTPFTDVHGNPIFIRWCEYGENCFLA